MEIAFRYIYSYTHCSLQVEQNPQGHYLEITCFRLKITNYRST